MVKRKFEGETKDEKFRRIATARTRRILNDLRLLGNCANTSTYRYTEKDVKRIFSTIEEEINHTKALFHKSKGKFSLN